jgi:hypothetical protein
MILPAVTNGLMDGLTRSSTQPVIFIFFLFLSLGGLGVLGCQQGIGVYKMYFHEATAKQNPSHLILNLEIL